MSYICTYTDCIAEVWLCVFTFDDDDITSHHTVTKVVAPPCNRGQSSFLTNITVRDCSFNRSVRGVRIKTVANSTVGPGCHGHVTDVLYKDITMTDVNTSISIIMHYPCADTMPAPLCWPKFNATSMQIDVTIENLTSVRVSLATTSFL